jgi:MazG family protein
MTEKHQMDRLLDIMAQLRDPLTGCPWDIRQTFASVAPYTLEEAFEVVDAIEQGDLDELRDELGDLLLQVVFHARMAEEAAAFDFADVTAAICDKMLRRHPHVFGDQQYADEQALHHAWEAHKREERAAKRKGEASSLLDGVTKALPAVVRAEKLQGKAARVGFDWDNPESVLDKVQEELDECRRAIAETKKTDRIEEELGDLLFSCVNLARHLRIDAEQSLRKANAKFERRFRAVERCMKAHDLDLKLEHREQMEACWEQVKSTPPSD